MKTLALGLTFTLLLLLPAQTRAPAQTAVPLETMGMPNGRAWRLMPQIDKATWVYGFQSGVMAALGAITKDGKEIAPESSRKEIINLYFSNLSRDEIAKGIDAFYQDTPENAPLPAAVALEYVTQRAGGATQSQLDDFVRAARKASAQ
ncbi:MAG TPA: hypothetical protein VNH65_02925 [Candidatus Acidoferrum sp.]|nr:hypothetical protein [Candidatus Acidoferrum sp.]